MRECDMLDWFILTGQVLVLGSVVMVVLFPLLLALYGMLSIHGFTIEMGWLERTKLIVD